MYRADGVELSSREYEVLARLVSYGGKTAPVNELMRDDTERRMLVGPMKTLRDKGLIRGTLLLNGFDYDGLTTLGECFIDDCKAEEWAELRRVWSDRRFQIAWSVATMVLSGAISYLVAWLMPRLLG